MPARPPCRGAAFCAIKKRELLYFLHVQNTMVYANTFGGKYDCQDRNFETILPIKRSRRHVDL